MIKHIAQGLAAMLLMTGGAALASPGNMAPPRASIGQDGAFYDDHYGPFYDGYWTAAGEYFFTTAPGRPYARDEAHHFSRVMMPGFRPVEGAAALRPGEVSASR